MKNVRELFATIGQNRTVPQFCPIHEDERVDATGFCVICQDEYVFDLSIEEIKRRVERIFLIHSPEGSKDDDHRLCRECHQVFPCPTIECLDGLP